MTPETEAELVEILTPDPVPRAWARLKAGLLVEAGRGDRSVAKRWQERIRASAWDPDEAARELAALTPVPDEDPALLARCSRLALDLWMAPTQKGVRGALRGARAAGRNLLAFALAQLLILLFFLLLFGVGLLLLRYYGVPLEQPLDQALGAVGLKAGSGEF
jgi:hypothetical protein